ELFRLPYHGQAHRAHLQSQLQVLLLPRKRVALSRHRELVDAAGCAGELHPAADRNTAERYDFLCLAGRRTDAARRRLLSKRGSAPGEACKQQENSKRTADQWRSPRRFMGTLSCREPFSGRNLNRRPKEISRHVSRG